MNKSQSPFASAHADLAPLGYTVLPLIPHDWMQHQGRGKCPGEYRSNAWQGLSRWQRFRDAAPSAFETGLWSKWPNANAGVVCGTSVGAGLHVVVLDFDADDCDVLDTLLRAAPASPMSKRGAKGESRFYVASKDLKTRSYDGPDGRILDVLTGFDTRQTVVPPSVHPKTGEPYQWVRGPVAATDLPELTADDMAALEEALEQCGWVRGGRTSAQREPRPAPPADSDDLWSEVKAAAMANLSAWVPALDLYGLRPARGGYEAVATWRASSTGRPIAERKLNLSVQANGIKDFGTNDTYSAIDLVMAARDCGQSEATDWLRERLGLKDEGVVIALAGPVKCPDPDDDLPERPRKSRQPARVFELNAWTASRLIDDPPPVEWLVRDAIPMAVPGMVAAQGDAGKSMLLLDLARRVAFNASPLEGPCFGGQVDREGTCVVLTAEDDAPAIHRRIANLDQKNARFSSRGERLIVVPLPDAGGPIAMVREGRNGLEATDDYLRLADQLAAIDDLALVVMDPLQAFVHAPINEDPAAGQFTCSILATLAAQTQATVLVAHHMRKGDRKTPVNTLQEAREMVRGTTALVDGLRLVYALWPETDGEARKACQRLGVNFEPNRVIRGGIVKANGPVRRTISTYVRSETGLLVDQSMLLAEAPADRAAQLAAMVGVVELAAISGAPFTKTGQSGLFEQKHRLPPILQELGRDKMVRVCDDALRRGLIVGCLAKGSSTAKWLDVPGGPIADGTGEFVMGRTRDQAA